MRALPQQDAVVMNAATTEHPLAPSARTNTHGGVIDMATTSKTATDKRKRVLNRQLNELRAQWWAWGKTGEGRYRNGRNTVRVTRYELIGCHGGHPALYVCDHEIPDPTCEACASELYRADRRAEIAAEGARVKRELSEINQEGSSS